MRQTVKGGGWEMGGGTQPGTEGQKRGQTERRGRQSVGEGVTASDAGRSCANSDIEKQLVDQQQE
jgi:hypothetical protein